MRSHTGTSTQPQTHNLVTVGYPTVVSRPDTRQWGTPLVSARKRYDSGVPHCRTFCVCVWVHVPVCGRVSVSWCVCDIDWVVGVSVRRVSRRYMVVACLYGADVVVLCVAIDASCCGAPRSCDYIRLVSVVWHPIYTHIYIYINI